MRVLSTALSLALSEGMVRPVYLIEFGHPAGTLRLWSGLGTLNYAGNVYTGAGSLLAVSAAVDSTELQVTQLSVSICLPDADDAVAKIVLQPVAFIPVTLYEAYLDIDSNVIPNIITRFVGRGDAPVIADTIDEATGDVTRIVTMAVYGAVTNLTAPVRTQLSNEEQTLKYPDDTGLSLMASLGSKQLQWTSGSYNSFSPPP